MNPWEEFLEVAGSYPPDIHEINAPCARDGISALEAELGPLPNELRDMLLCFNGGEFFIDAIPLITFFGLSAVEPAVTPAIDMRSRTLEWREGGRDRAAEWALGVWNYGGHLIVGQHSTRIREWDSASSKWSQSVRTFDELRDEVLSEGRAYLEE